MPAYAADTLDLSRISVDDIIPGEDFEATRARYVDAFLRYWNRLREARPSLPAYDVEGLRSDPVAVIGEAASYVRTLERAAFDERARSLLMVTARGGALDHIGRTYYGVGRLVLIPAAADGSGEVLEADDAYRYRLQLAPETGRARRAAKTLGGYVYQALSCDARVRAADSASLARGNVTVAVLAHDGHDPDEVTAAVRGFLAQDDVKGATDILSVRPADVLVVDVAATLYALNGPDASTLTTAAEASYRAFVAQRGPFRAPLYGQAIDARLQVPGVERALRRVPADDVLAPFGTVIRPGRVDLVVERVGPTYG